MSVQIDGIVTYLSVHTTWGLDGRPQDSSVRIVIRQTTTRAPHVQLVLPAGHGHPGLTLADATRNRLPHGTPCTAIGGWVGTTPDPRTLTLHDAEFVRARKPEPVAA